MRRSFLSCTMLLAAASLGCSDGDGGAEIVAANAIAAECAVPAEVSAQPVVVAGDWWNAGAMPPTLRLEQDGSALRAELAFSGVIHRGGTGRVRGACVELTFPARVGRDRPLVVEGRLLFPSMRLRIALEDGTAFVLERRPPGR